MDIEKLYKEKLSPFKMEARLGSKIKMITVKMSSTISHPTAICPSVSLKDGYLSACEQAQLYLLHLLLNQ